MIVGGSSSDTAVKFVSYDGEYPCLCRGTLTLKIDGKNVTFGNSENCDYPRFWSSGGGVGFDDNWSNSFVLQGQWEIDVNDLPEHLRKYASEIDEAFNCNVEHGCCGGCI